MKRKIFSILFAVVLVLSFSLVTAVPVAEANGGPVSVTLPSDSLTTATGAYQDAVKVYPYKWDVTKGDLTIEGTIDLGEIKARGNTWDPDLTDADDWFGLWTQIGLSGSPVFNSSDGVWMVTVEWTGGGDDLDTQIREILHMQEEPGTQPMPKLYTDPRTIVGGDGDDTYTFKLQIHSTGATTGWAKLWIDGEPIKGDMWSVFTPEEMTYSGEDLSNAQVLVGIMSGNNPNNPAHTFSWSALTVTGYPASYSEVWVDDEWVGTALGTEVELDKFFGFNAFATIQDGIDAVAGSTVNVAAGTYSEHIVITTSNLTLVGEDRETTIIDARQDSSWSYPKPGILINGVSGVTVSGFTIQDAAIDENGDPFYPSTGWGPQAKTAILIYASSSNNAVENNILINNFWGVFVCAEGSATTECRNNRVANNIIRDSEQDGVYLYTDGVVPVENTEIINNEMDNLYGTYASGVEFWVWPGTAPYNLAITGTVIRGNNITNCTYGFRIRDDVSDITGTLVNFNNFIANTNYGIYNGVASTIDATNNWWGHASGPSGPDGRVNKKGKVIGKGDAILGNVDWDPWLPQPIRHTKHDPVPPGLFD